MLKEKTRLQYVVEFMRDNTEKFENYREAARACIKQNKMHNSDRAVKTVAGWISKIVKGEIDTDDYELKSSGVDSKGVALQSDIDEMLTFDNGWVPDTLEQALEYSEVDLKEWEVTKHVWNRWGNSDNPCAQLKLFFSRKEFDPVESLERVLRNYEIENKDKTFVFSKFKIDKFEKEDAKAAIINLYDAHLDKISLLSTTGSETTVQDNVDLYNESLTKLIDSISGQDIDQIFYPLGNDLFHTNDFNGNTKKGTKLEDLVDPYETYETISQVAIESINQLSHIAPVKVIMIHGNHDYDKIHTLAVMLGILFKDNPLVEIDDSRKARKYFQYGKNLFGFSHGDKQKSKIAELPLMMAQENAENGYWGGTKFRQFYCGDLHHNFTYKMLQTKDFIGVNVTFLRSLSGEDTWHYDNGYIGVPKTASVDIWSKENGRVGVVERSII